MKEITIDPSKLSELEICPRQFHLKYEYEAELPKMVRDDIHEQELIGKCVQDILKGEHDIKRIVANNLEKMNILFQPDRIKDVIRVLTELSPQEGQEGAILSINQEFEQTYTISGDSVKIRGLIHQIERKKDGTIKATIYKGENRLYIHDWLVKSYLPIIYGLVLHQLYNANKIVISYFMAKHNSEVWVEFENADWDFNKKMIEIQLNKLSGNRKDDAVVGNHCPYCPRKSVCNEYKREIMESFEIRSINEFFSLGMEEIIEYIIKLDNQKGILKGKVEELKTILLQELLNNGKDQANFHDYALVIEQKKSMRCDDQAILEQIKAEDHHKVAKIDGQKLETYLNSIPPSERVKILSSTSTKFYKPSLRIKKRKEGDIVGKEITLADFISIS